MRAEIVVLNFHLYSHKVLFFLFFLKEKKMKEGERKENKISTLVEPMSTIRHIPTGGAEYKEGLKLQKAWLYRHNLKKA